MEIFWTFFYIILTFLFFAYSYIKYSYRYWKNRSVAYVEPKFPFGNVTGKIFLDIKMAYEKLKNHNKPFFGFFVFLRPAIVITDLDLLKTVIIKDFDYFHDRGGFHNEKNDPLSEHLLNIEGEKWKNLRAKLTPTFSSGKMKYMFTTVVGLGQRLSDTINSMSNQLNEVDIKDLMSRYTTDVIGTCAFGIECNSLKDPNGEFVRVGRELFAVTRWGSIKRFFCNNFQSLARFMRMKAHQDQHIDFFKNIVTDTIENREKNNIKRRDFMDLLIDMKNSKEMTISFNDILANCYAFFAAGYETSSSLMTYTLYEMAQHLDIQQKVRDEVNTVLARHDGELTYEALKEMTYLEQVINESLRLHTPAPVTGRIVTKDYKIPDTDIILEKGLRVFLPYFLVHLDPLIYENPEQFNPDRFTKEAIADRHPMSFLAFGDGPRNCIGLRFGRMESKIGLAILMKNFKFTNSKNTKVPIKVDWRSFVILAPQNLVLNVEKISS